MGTGAIYTTTNAGRNWKAEVKESIDATLNRVSSSGVSGASYYSGSVGNIKRAADGSYLSVASRGNFYLTWKPGDDFWLPHNRGTPRRITAMGYVGNNAANGVWMTLNGGDGHRGSLREHGRRARILGRQGRFRRLRDPRLRL